MYQGYPIPVITQQYATHARKPPKCLPFPSPSPPIKTMSTWLVKTRRAPSRHSRDARVNGHTTTVMHKLSTPSPPHPMNVYTLPKLLPLNPPPAPTPPPNPFVLTVVAGVRVAPPLVPSPQPLPLADHRWGGRRRRNTRPLRSAAGAWRRREARLVMVCRAQTQTEIKTMEADTKKSWHNTIK